MSINLLKRKIPDTYQEVEYIANSGTQFINTQYTPTENCGFEIKWIDLVSDAGTSNAGSNYVMGSRNGTGGNIYFAVSGTTAGQTITITRTGVTTGQYYRRYNYVYVAKATFRTAENSGELSCLTTGDTFTGTQTSPLNAEVPVYLFAMNSQQIHKKVGIYYAKFYDGNGNLIYHFVPCYRKSDNKIGMYEVINGVFYQNSGTGNFTKSTDIDNFIVTKVKLQLIHNNTIESVNVYLIDNGTTIKV